VENARLFALVNIAMADAGIASWETKYIYDLWRPVVGIRNGHLDGNPDTPGEPDWRPLGAPASNSGDPDGDFTPPFPAYTSGHATFGGAVFRILERFYGTDDIAFDAQSDELNGITEGANGEIRPAVTRHFDSFGQAMEENAQSRIYLGIHWQFDAQEGIKQGSAIADYVFDNKFLVRQVFHNPDHVMDVNADGSLTMADVLTQVQQLRHLRETGKMEPDFFGFCDVNDDEQFTLADLLGVVQAMRLQLSDSHAHGEGEGLAASEIPFAVPNFGFDLISVGEPEDEAAVEPASEVFDPPAEERALIDLVWQEDDFLGLGNGLANEEPSDRQDDLLDGESTLFILERAP
jgi:hypothetical protein